MLMTFSFHFSLSKQSVNVLFDAIFMYVTWLFFFFFLVVVPSASPQRSVDQRSTTTAPSAPVVLTPVVNGESNNLTPSVPYPAAALVSQNQNENEGHLNPTEKLQ